MLTRVVDYPNSEQVGPNRPALADGFGRKITYLRLSITDRCDFRCTYCMTTDMRFLKREEVLSFEECRRIVQAFVSSGITKVRVTGGEPLARKDAPRLMRNLAALPGLKHLVMTTNGSQLEDYAGELKAAGVERLNISLDSLDPERFLQVTRIGKLDKVLAGIRAAQAAGFTRTKLNTVVQRGINDRELGQLVRFADAQGLDITFIEEMPLGDIDGRTQTYVSSEAARRILADDGIELRPSDETTGGPARYWQLAGSATRIGFISPHSHNFCDTCNRVRVTASGEFYPCLGHNGAIPLLPALRDGCTDEELLALVRRGLNIKPKGHDFTAQLERPQVVRFMSMTGG